MWRRPSSPWIAVASALAAGCAPDGHPRGRSHVTWDDVSPVLEQCVACHDRSGLTYPLTTWSEAAPLAPLLAEVTTSGRMPPWPAGPAGVAYVDDPTLGEDEIALLAAWDEAGAPLGRADPDEALALPEPDHLPRIDATFEMPAAYVPAAGVDEYRCFALDGSLVADRYVTGVEGFPGERAEIHHLVLYAVVPRDPAQRPALLDAADPAPGWGCADRIAGDVTYFGGWLPGRDASLLPEGLGLELADEAELVMELHYSGPATGGLPDRSSIAVMTEPAVVAPAELVPVTRAARGVAVAAGSTATYTRTLSAESFLVEEGGSLAWAVTPHMHTHGTSITLDRVREGVALRLVDVPAWDFDWQFQYRFVEPVDLLPTDEFVLTCTYENLGETDVLWGDTTGDEMCLTRLLMSPASSDPRER